MTQQNEDVAQTSSPETDDADTIVQPPTTAGGADMTQLQTENTDLKAAIRLGEARQQLTAALARAGARSPELLFDAIKGELKFTETGKLENPRA